MGLIDSAILILLAVLIWVLSGCVMLNGATMELGTAPLGAETYIIEQETEEIGGDFGQLP